MKRILILANTDIVIYNFRKELIAELIYHGFEVYISATISIWRKELTEVGCILLDTPIDRHGINPFRDLKLILHYIKFFREIKPHVLLTYTIKPNIYGNLVNKLYGIPNIINITGLGTALEKKGILQRLLIRLYKISLSNASCVFFQNVANQHFFDIHKIKINNYKLVNGSGVNLDLYSKIPYPSEESPIIFAYIGRVMKDKGIEEYLKAAAYIKKKYPLISFHVCGFCEDGYEKTIKKNNHVLIEYHGMLKDIKKILELSSCVILPSYHEGMSNSLLEAAASGRPLMASNIPGCSEIIEDGKNGFIFEPRNSDALINAVEKFVSLPYSLRKEMGEKGREKMELEFDRTKIVDIYLNEIFNLLKNNPSGG